MQRPERLAPRRYGSPPAQFKAFWDSTGQLWQQGKLVGKTGGFFFSTATQGGGQETTAWTGAWEQSLCHSLDTAAAFI